MLTFIKVFFSSLFPHCLLVAWLEKKERFLLTTHRYIELVLRSQVYPYVPDDVAGSRTVKIKVSLWTIPPLDYHVDNPT